MAQAVDEEQVVGLGSLECFKRNGEQLFMIFLTSDHRDFFEVPQEHFDASPVIFKLSRVCGEAHTIEIIQPAVCHLECEKMKMKWMLDFSFSCDAQRDDLRRWKRVYAPCCVLAQYVRLSMAYAQLSEDGVLKTKSERIANGRRGAKSSNGQRRKGVPALASD